MIYKEKIRDIMSRCLDIPKYELGRKNGFKVFESFYKAKRDEIEKTFS